MSDNSIRLHKAALKYKVQVCERRNIIFTKEGRRPKIIKPHKALSEADIALLFDSTNDDLYLHTLLRFLYDTAGRLQDAVAFDIEGLNLQYDKDISIVLKPKKSATQRKVVLTAPTVNSILMYLNGRNTGYLFTQKKDALRKKISACSRDLQIKFSAHDLRKSRATHLYKSNTLTIL